MAVESFLMGNVDSTLKQKFREALFVRTWRRNNGTTTAKSRRKKQTPTARQ
jgi:hypothetical protein